MCQIEKLNNLSTEEMEARAQFGEKLREELTLISYQTSL